MSFVANLGGYIREGVIYDGGYAREFTVIDIEFAESLAPAWNFNYTDLIGAVYKSIKPCAPRFSCEKAVKVIKNE